MAGYTVHFRARIKKAFPKLEQSDQTEYNPVTCRYYIWLTMGERPRDEMDREIWTIGHSTRSLADFVEILRSFQIELLVDIRTFPGSRRYPHFNKDALDPSLQENGISYRHMIELGGRRKPDPHSVNAAWRHSAFRGYADYMQTEAFTKAVTSLEQLASQKRVCYMCSEAVWWKCHRALVSDFLKARGWTVWHISGVGKSKEHPYTSPARVEQGKLNYSHQQLRFGAE